MFFVTEVYSRDCDIKLQALKIDDNSDILNKAVIQSVVENSTTRNVKRMRDLILHSYEDDQRVSLVVENKVRSLFVWVRTFSCLGLCLIKFAVLYFKIDLKDTYGSLKTSIFSFVIGFLTATIIH